jgi:hypothetical protein
VLVLIVAFVVLKVLLLIVSAHVTTYVYKEMKKIKIIFSKFSKITYIFQKTNIVVVIVTFLSVKLINDWFGFQSLYNTIIFHIDHRYVFQKC